MFQSTIVDSCTVGMEELQRQQLFSIFPNPASGSFMISLNNDASESALTIFDMMGRAVFETTLSAGRKEHTIALNLSKGVYAVRVTTERIEAIKKLVVE
jgi:extracellular elastinolytic metalloproteinase